MLNSPDVLDVTAGSGGRYHVGTGFNIRTPSGGVVGVTAAHVCDTALQGILVYDFNTKPWGFTHILAVDPKNDICLIEAVGGHPALEMARDMFPHQSISTIGYPGGHPQKTTYGMSIGPYHAVAERGGDKQYYCGGEGSKLLIFTNGVKTSYRCIHEVNVISSSVDVRGGNSGGPVLDGNNQVVGVLDMENKSHKGAFIPLTPLWQLLSHY